MQMMDRKLLDLQATTSECKENLGQLLETEADFRVEHIQQKNQFIQTYTQVLLLPIRAEMPSARVSDSSWAAEWETSARNWN